MRKSRYKTGDRIVIKDHIEVAPDMHGLEGKIVGWVPEGPPDPWVRYPGARIDDGEHFLVWLDNPPTRVTVNVAYRNGTYVPLEPSHHGIFRDAYVDPAAPDPTIGEIADLFGVDPADIAQAALDEVEAEMRIERILRGDA